MIGLMLTNAEAQTTKNTGQKKDCVCPAKKATVKKTVKVNKAPASLSRTRTFQVCREEGGYYSCCVHNRTTTMAVK